MNIVHALAAHLGAVIGSSGLVAGFVLAQARKRLPGILAADLAEAIAGIEKKLTRPEDLAAFRAILAALAVRVPGAGDALPAQAAAKIVAEVPQLAPVQAQLADLIADMTAAVKTDLGKA